jgi:hypothetical protein
LIFDDAVRKFSKKPNPKKVETGRRDPVYQAVEKLRLSPPFSVARRSPMLTYA